jgi:mannose-1-phosphate guanylyltransferase
MRLFPSLENPSERTPQSIERLCGIVLAGGEGRRLRPFVHLLRKDLLPKQYVNFIGKRSMLEHTLDRAEKLIAPERLFTILNEAHLGFPEVKRQISHRPAETIIVQPENKDTGPGLLFALMHLWKQHPGSTVVIFPSDQFVLEEDKLIQYVHEGHRLVQNDPTRLVLLGIEPDKVEEEYGYIVPAQGFKSSARAFPVGGFVEKPELGQAGDLISRGALWNTMVMIFKIDTLLEIVRKTTPAIYSIFQEIFDAVGTSRRKTVVRKIYRQISPVNFSKEMLEPFVRAHPSRLVAIPVRGVLWSDWGTETRVIEVLRRTGHISRLNGLSLVPEPLAIRPRPESRTGNSSSRSKQRGEKITARSLLI